MWPLQASGVGPVYDPSNTFHRINNYHCTIQYSSIHNSSHTGICDLIYIELHIHVDAIILLY